MLCHICHKCFSASHRWLHDYSQLWPARGDGRVKSFSPLFFLLLPPRQSTFRDEDAGVLGNMVQAKLLRPFLAHFLFPWTFFLSPLPVLNAAAAAASVPSVYRVTSCGSRLCGWGLTPPLVSGHWWSPLTFQGTPPSGPGTREKCRNKSPTSSQPAGKHTKFNKKHMVVVIFITYSIRVYPYVLL